MAILHMIPQIWKVRIKLTKKITVITCENFEYVKKKQEIVPITFITPDTHGFCPEIYKSRYNT
jgi:hypothetical protein